MMQSKDRKDGLNGAGGAEQVADRALSRRDGEPVRVNLPSSASFKVTYADPTPSTATNESKGTTFKSAILENGATLQVPEFVQTGDVVVVDLAEAKYRSRG
ncbi:hypothetical protein HK405_004542 [Cladochytrium tenue]|nr:hypothetical protein HK405_004542 [Cladochytrium tenue]